MTDHKTDPVIVEFSEDDIWDDERREEARDKIDSLEHNGRHLTRWERDFLVAARQHLTDYGFLTPNQDSKLNGLYDQKLF